MTAFGGLWRAKNGCPLERCTMAPNRVLRHWDGQSLCKINVYCSWALPGKDRATDLPKDVFWKPVGLQWHSQLAVIYSDPALAGLIALHKISKFTHVCDLGDVLHDLGASNGTHARPHCTRKHARADTACRHAAKDTIPWRFTPPHIQVHACQRETASSTPASFHTSAGIPSSAAALAKRLG